MQALSILDTSRMDVMDQQQPHGRDVCQRVYKTVCLPFLGHHGILSIRFHTHSLSFIHSFIHPSIHPSIHSFIQSFNSFSNSTTTPEIRQFNTVVETGP